MSSNIDYYKELAEKGDPASMHYYGYLLYTGQGVTKNEPQGFHYIKLAADAGSVDALYFCGNELIKGKGKAGCIF